MKLINKYKGSKYNVINHYYCEIASALDNLANIDENDYRKHYILANDFCKEKRFLAIRVFGCTVGGVWIDNDNVIIRIFVDTNYAIGMYPNSVNERLKKFVGEKIEFDEVESEENS